MLFEAVDLQFVNRRPPIQTEKFVHNLEVKFKKTGKLSFAKNLN